jgi:hypothetical protein
VVAGGEKGVGAAGLVAADELDVDVLGAAGGVVVESADG